MTQHRETQSQRLRWEHAEAGRYYEAHLARDLFGQWVLTRVWGGCGSARGRVTHTPFTSYRAACTRLTQVVARRRARGYAAVISR